MKAKAEHPNSASDAIIVSFAAEWYEKLRQNRVHAIIRKRIPRTVYPRLMYFHFNAPKSAICARAEILSIADIPAEIATTMARELGMSPGSILDYTRGEGSIGCYRLGKFQFATCEVSTHEIASHMVYFPPQSFLVLAADAKAVLDRLCGFQPMRPERHR